ncbi:hypothetical protein [Streptomyces sp. NRRL B-24085]|uniref:hypothetical protein n=1 Tax=Streptomyces sp. NRRL B-24085 TaxID=1709476 RepID=UPI000B225DB8|nr:hypothetical protein [Streptomyces sp. NRRL B-24085]
MSAPSSVAVTPGSMFFTWISREAEPGSPSEQALALLGSLAAAGAPADRTAGT